MEREDQREKPSRRLTFSVHGSVVAVLAKGMAVPEVDDTAAFLIRARILSKPNERWMSRPWRSPIDGTVQQLALHTVGGVLAPVQQLMTIMPADSRLEVEAMIPNRALAWSLRPSRTADCRYHPYSLEGNAQRGFPIAVATQN